MIPDEKYERDHLRSFVEARTAGEVDALTGKFYAPLRTPYKEHRSTLSASAYMGGWVDAVCASSTWRRVLYRIAWRVGYWSVRVGRKGLER